MLRLLALTGNDHAFLIHACVQAAAAAPSGRGARYGGRPLLGGAPEAVETTGLFWHDRRPRPVTYLIGAGADDDAARQELWDHIAALARRSQARPA